MQRVKNGIKPNWDHTLFLHFSRVYCSLILIILVCTVFPAQFPTTCRTVTVVFGGTMIWPSTLCSGPFSISEIVFQLYPVDDETPEDGETWSLNNEWNYGKCNMSKWNQFQCWSKWMWILFKIEYNRIYLTGSVFYVANQILSVAGMHFPLVRQKKYPNNVRQF